jgi:hypothetical protein
MALIPLPTFGRGTPPPARFGGPVPQPYSAILPGDQPLDRMMEQMRFANNAQPAPAFPQAYQSAALAQQYQVANASPLSAALPAIAQTAAQSAAPPAEIARATQQGLMDGARQAMMMQFGGGREQAGIPGGYERARFNASPFLRALTNLMAGRQRPGVTPQTAQRIRQRRRLY